MTKERKNLSLLPLTSDFVFKAVYGQNTPQSNAALRALLNLLLDRKEDPIEWVHCENPFVLSDHITGKESIMDIKLRLSSGQMIDLEMQVSNLDNYINRSIFYMGKLIVSSLSKGENYDKMKPTIVISIIDGILLPGIEDPHSQFTLSERRVKMELSDLTQVHFLELAKIDLNKPVREMSSHERIGAYFKCASDESKQSLIAELTQYEPEVITLTKPIFEEVSYDERMRDLEEAHDKYVRTLKTVQSESEDRIAKLTLKLIEDNRLEDLKRASIDKDFREELLKEYHLRRI